MTEDQIVLATTSLRTLLARARPRLRRHALVAAATLIALGAGGWVLHRPRVRWREVRDPGGAWSASFPAAVSEKRESHPTQTASRVATRVEDDSFRVVTRTCLTACTWDVNEILREVRMQVVQKRGIAEPVRSTVVLGDVVAQRLDLNLDDGTWFSAVVLTRGRQSFRIIASARDRAAADRFVTSFRLEPARSEERARVAGISR